MSLSHASNIMPTSVFSSVFLSYRIKLSISHIKLLNLFVDMQDPKGMVDEKSESRAYISDHDQRITEANVIKMFSSLGKIVLKIFLWHTRGPKHG